MYYQSTITLYAYLFLFKLKMMEHELVTLLGISLQDELSSRENSSLCENVFHVPVYLEEVHDAVKKVRTNGHVAFYIFTLII